MNNWLITFLMCGLVFVYMPTIVETGSNKEAETPSISGETKECLECHSVYTPGIVEDRLTSRPNTVFILCVSNGDKSPYYELK